MSKFQNIGCLIKTQFKNITQTIFQRGSPWATLILNSIFVVGVHYCAIFFGSKKTKSFSPFLFLSFTNTFLFYTFLAPFFWFLKMSNFQNIGCLIKTQLKNITQTIFRGVVHEQPWSSIVSLLWGSTIVSNFFWKKLKTQNHSLMSFSFPLLILFSFTRS